MCLIWNYESVDCVDSIIRLSTMVIVNIIFRHVSCWDSLESIVDWGYSVDRDLLHLTLILFLQFLTLSGLLHSEQATAAQAPEWAHSIHKYHQRHEVYHLVSQMFGILPRNFIKVKVQFKFIKSSLLVSRSWWRWVLFWLVISLWRWRRVNSWWWRRNRCWWARMLLIWKSLWLFFMKGIIWEYTRICWLNHMR